MLLHFGCVPALVVSSDDVVYDVMKTHDLKFSNHPKTKTVEKLIKGTEIASLFPLRRILEADEGNIFTNQKAVFVFFIFRFVTNLFDIIYLNFGIDMFPNLDD